ncbi:MAG: hypothetical protein EOP34_04905 [Rickettsiales bacterium]|nr:MAG: hypothetical protein EOP34_04905 [Rickettsiales bacterium]
MLYQDQGLASYVHATLHEIFRSNDTIVTTLVTVLGMGAGIQMGRLVDRLSSINTETSISIMNSLTSFKKA